MTTGQGAEVHINDAAYAPRCVGLMQPVRRDERILKAQRERDTLAVAGSAQRHPVAADRHISRPVHQEIQSPSPSVYNRHAVPNLGHPQAESGQNVAVFASSTLKSLRIAHNARRDIVPAFGNVFSYCTHRASSQTHPNSRAPTRANTPSEQIHPPGPHSDGVTPSQEAAYG